MSDKPAPFIEPDQMETLGRTITVRWNQGEPDADGWQPQAVVTVTHHAGRGYRAIAMNAKVRSVGPFAEEDLGAYQYAVVLDLPTKARYSVIQLRRFYADAVSELQRRLNAGDAELATYFPQHD